MPPHTGFSPPPRVTSHPKVSAAPLPRDTGNTQAGSHHRLLPGSPTAGRPRAEPEADTSEEALLSLTRPGFETVGLSQTFYVLMEKSVYLRGPSFSHLQNEKAEFDKRFSKLSCLILKSEAL